MKWHIKICTQGSNYMLCQSPALAKHALCIVTSDIKSTLSSGVGLHSSVTAGPNMFSEQHNGPSSVCCLSAWAKLSFLWQSPMYAPVHSLGHACTCVRTHTHTHLNRFKYKYNTTERREYESKVSVLNSSSHMQQFSLHNYHSKSVTKSHSFF
jgi:hypothetical protein